MLNSLENIQLLSKKITASMKQDKWDEAKQLQSELQDEIRKLTEKTSAMSSEEKDSLTPTIQQQMLAVKTQINKQKEISQKNKQENMEEVKKNNQSKKMAKAYNS